MWCVVWTRKNSFIADAVWSGYDVSEAQEWWEMLFDCAEANGCAWSDAAGHNEQAFYSALYVYTWHSSAAAAPARQALLPLPERTPSVHHWSPWYGRTGTPFFDRN